MATTEAGVVRAGFKPDRVLARVALLVWFVSLAATLVSVWPAWSWWSTALEYAPRGDTMAQRFDLVVFKEMVQFDRTSAIGMTQAALTAGAVVALLLNPLLSGGALAIVASPSTGVAIGARFFESGAHFYGRFLRALVYVAVPAAIALSLVSGAGGALADHVAGRGLERAAIVVSIAWMIVVAAIAGFFTAVLDLARLRVLLLDSREVLAAVLSAAWFGLRRAGTLLRVGIVFAVSLVLLVAGAIWLRAVLPGDGWGWLAVGIVIHQVATYGRMRLRLAVMASELALARRDWASLRISAPSAPSSEPAAPERATWPPIIE